MMAKENMIGDDKMLFELFIQVVLLIALAGGVAIVANSSRGAASTASLAVKMKKYKDDGRRCTGKSPELWHYSDGGTGLSLRYTVDGEDLRGVLDRSFGISERELNQIIMSGEEVAIIVSPDDPGEFCLAKEFYSTEGSERLRGQLHRMFKRHKDMIFCVKGTVFVTAMFGSMIILKYFLAG